MWILTEETSGWIFPSWPYHLAEAQLLTPSQPLSSQKGNAEPWPRTKTAEADCCGRALKKKYMLYRYAHTITLNRLSCCFCGSGQPGLVVGNPVCGRGVKTRWSLWSFSTQAILWFHDSMILWFSDYREKVKCHNFAELWLALHLDKGLACLYVFYVRPGSAICGCCWRLFLSWGSLCCWTCQCS